MMEKKILRIKGKSRERIAVFEIVLLICSTIAFAYLIGGAFSGVEAQEDDPGIAKARADIQDIVPGSERDNAESLLKGLDENLDYANGLWQIIEKFVPMSGGIDGGEIFDSIADSTGGVSTCPKSKDGKICQEYITQGCDEKCDGRCLERSRDQLSEDSPCKLGTCYDTEEGTCAPRSSKDECEGKSGEWFNDPEANVPQCEKGCCIIGDQPFFVTARQCEKRAESLGVELGSGNAQFSSEITSELVCIAQADINALREGACTFALVDDLWGKKGCKRTTQRGCEEINGELHEGMLCSNRDLNTDCEPRKITKCVEGLDEVYWFDSCDNKENIYDSASVDDGLIKKKEESCAIGTVDNVVLNQDSCGNCNRFIGSACGDETSEDRVQELNDAPDGGVVCRDLSCYENGVRRDHGESWCAYQSAVGVDSIGIGGIEIPGADIVGSIIGGGFISSRAMDTPGSKHFRKSCVDGEIITESCGDYRNKICVEEQAKKEYSDDVISAATCRVNRWQECLAYNPNALEGRLIAAAGRKKGGKLLELVVAARCGKDPDCFVKKVDLTSKSSDTFEFAMCLPRYSPGFDSGSEDGRAAAEQICGKASQECTVVYVKTLSGWECKANCECEKKKFTQQMNDLCMSFGDCGFEVNYVGALPGGPGYMVTKDGKSDLGLMQLSPLYVARLTTYANAVQGRFIDGKISEIYAHLGKSVDKLLGNSIIQQTISRFQGGDAADGTPDIPESGGEKVASAALPIAGISGALGVGYLVGQAAGVLPVSYSVLAGGKIIATGLTQAAAGDLAASTAAPLATGGAPVGIQVTYGGYGGALMGAAAGVAITSVLINALGIGPGLDSFTAGSLIATGGVGGGLVGFKIATAGFTKAALTGVGAVGIVMVVAVIIVITIFKIIGIGEIKKIKYKFECMPWEPPRGGAQCDKCGKDVMSDGSNEFPCSRYSCEALGNCRFIEESEGPKGGICVGADKSDTKAPRIVSAHSGEEFEIREFSDVGFKVRKKGESGDKECVNQFEKVEYGFELDEYGRCRVSGDALAKFEEMADFGDRGVLLKDHNALFTGFEDAKAFDIELGELGLRKDISLYVKCQDALENVNENAYVINLCIIRDDYTPPRIIMVEPLTKYLPFGTNIKDLTVYVNEPSELRWSGVDKDFDEMENVFDCEINPENRLPQGFECKTSVPIDDDEEVIYIRAKDQPKLQGTIDEGRRNENQQSVSVSFRRTETVLSIDSIEPSEEVIEIGGDVASVNLGVRTSGGLVESTSCSVDFDGLFDLLPKTDNGLHKKTYERFSVGVHTLRVHCSDGAGNSVEKSTTFSIKKDTEIPLVTRVYADNNFLFVVTNEKAQCGFVNNPEPGMMNACGFGLEKAQGMESYSDELVHHVVFDKDKTYYIRCKDRFDNQRVGECDIVVKEGVV